MTAPPVGQLDEKGEWWPSRAVHDCLVGLDPSLLACVAYHLAYVVCDEHGDSGEGHALKCLQETIYQARDSDQILSILEADASPPEPSPSEKDS